MKSLKKIVSFCAIFTLSAGIVFSKSITFPVKSLVTIEENPVSITTGWDEKWFGQNSAKVYNHNIARIAGILSAVSYEDSDIGKDSNLILQCFKALGVSEDLIEFHYNLDYENSMWGNDQAAFTFATKQIESSKGRQNLIFIVIRGTPLNANEWISNVNISDKTKTEAEYHEGFFKSTKLLETALIAYLFKNKIDITNCYLLITGHSRGAAISNLLAAQLYDTTLFNPDNIYTYTFAAPNVTTKENTHDPKYDYIWNIINAEDIVPSVPPFYKSWKYSKYGQTKVLINSWNTDPVKYEQYYLKTMNSYFSKFMLRNYSPFMTGPFLPIQCSSILSSINKNVYTFYSGISALHDKAISAFWKIFPPEEKTAATEEEQKNEPTSKNVQEKQGALFAAATRWSYKNFGVDVNYVMNCFSDMHAMETYLSWILALDEENVYSTVGANLMVLKGAGDYAVFDEKGTKVATILDGRVNFSKVAHPVAANSLLQGSVVLGLPANRSYTVVASRESLIPTRLKMNVQHYSAEGIFIDETQITPLYPYNGQVYCINAESKKLLDDDFSFSKVTGKDAKELRKAGDLRMISKFNVSGEFSASTSGTFNLGAHVGTNAFYGSLLLGHNAAKVGRSLELSPGIGHQSLLVNKILLNTELYTNFFYAFSDDLADDDDRFNIVPSARFSLSFKPIHRTQIFVAANLDLHISDFNDAAFDDSYRLKTTGQVWTDSKFRIVPNFSFGIRF